MRVDGVEIGNKPELEAFQKTMALACVFANENGISFVAAWHKEGIGGSVWMVDDSSEFYELIDTTVARFLQVEQDSIEDENDEVVQEED